MLLRKSLVALKILGGLNLPYFNKEDSMIEVENLISEIYEDADCGEEEFLYKLGMDNNSLDIQQCIGIMAAAASRGFDKIIERFESVFSTGIIDLNLILLEAISYIGEHSNELFDYIMELARNYDFRFSFETYKYNKESFITYAFIFENNYAISEIMCNLNIYYKLDEYEIECFEDYIKNHSNLPRQVFNKILRHIEEEDKDNLFYDLLCGNK